MSLSCRHFRRIRHYIDHSLLLHWLSSWFGVSGTDWSTTPVQIIGVKGASKVGEQSVRGSITVYRSWGINKHRRREVATAKAEMALATSSSVERIPSGSSGCQLEHLMPSCLPQIFSRYFHFEIREHKPSRSVNNVTKIIDCRWGNWDSFVLENHRSLAVAAMLIEIIISRGF